MAPYGIRTSSVYASSIVPVSMVIKPPVPCVLARVPIVLQPRRYKRSTQHSNTVGEKGGVNEGGGAKDSNAGRVFNVRLFHIIASGNDASWHKNGKTTCLVFVDPCTCMQGMFCTFIKCKSRFEKLVKSFEKIAELTTVVNRVGYGE
jgi:hypothetical protein